MQKNLVFSPYKLGHIGISERVTQPYTHTYMVDSGTAPAWVGKLLRNTEKNFASECVLWTIRRCKNQNCEINQGLCPTVPDDWNPRNLSGVVVWASRSQNRFADCAFAFQREFDEHGSSSSISSSIRKFPFVMAMAYPFSTLFQTLVEASSLGGAAPDKTYCIPPEVTEDEAVVECILFYIHTGLVIDVKALTKDWTISIFEALTHETVARPEFTFDIMVYAFLPYCILTSNLSMVCFSSLLCMFIDSFVRTRVLPLTQNCCRSCTTLQPTSACTS